MVDYYIFGGSVFDDPACKVYTYADLSGYDESLYWATPRVKSDAHMVAGDPFWRLGGLEGGQERAELGVFGKFKIEIDDLGIWGIEEGEDPVDLLIGGGGGCENVFKTIDCPVGTDPVAETCNDTLVLTSADSSVTITGTVATDTVDFSVTLDSAFDGGKEINGATSSANAFKVGDCVEKILLYGIQANNKVYIEVVGGGELILLGGDLKADNNEKVYDAVYN